MKQLASTILLVVLMSMTSNKSFAYDIAVKNADSVTIYYNYINNGTELEVTSESKFFYGNVVIPEEVTYMDRTLKVTSIGKEAFYECRNMTSVTIPNSVTSIGEYAFYECISLNYVTIGNSVTSIGNGAFYECWNLKPITIPNSVTSIGNGAFSGCKRLTSVTIGNGVTSIGDKAFVNCSSLTSVHISDIAAWCKIDFSYYFGNPLQNAHHLFLGDEEIKDLVIPNSVTSIAERAFWGCSGLTSVTIPNSVTSIGIDAFSDCTGLTSLTIPDNLKYADNAFRSSLERLETVKISVTNMSTLCQNDQLDFFCINSKHVFLIDEEGREIVDLVITGDVDKITNSVIPRCCNNFTSIKVDNENTVYDSRNNCNAIIETESNSLIAGCQNTIIPNDVTSIGKFAFAECSGLTSVTILNSVTSIGESAFAGCTSIQYVRTYITEPYSISKNVFPDEVYRKSPLYIPAGTEKLYSRYDGWREFLNIVEMDESEQPEMPGADKCATPTISYENGQLNFSCTTEGVEYKYKIEASDNKEGYGNGIKITKTYKVTVYAFKDGMNTSDPAIANITLAGDGDTNGDGVVNAADIVEIVNIIMGK